MYEDLYQLYLTSIKEDCEKYLSTKNALIFHKHAADTTRIYEINKAVFNKEYDIISTNYQGYFGEKDLCTIIAKFLLKENNSTSPDSILLDICIPCFMKDDTIFYESVRANFTRKIISNDLKTTTDISIYRSVLDYMYDIIMEYDLSNSSFVYDKDAYKDLFHIDTNYSIMDEWFWDFCSYYVHEDDKEKIDLFRDADINKRIQNNDLVIQTHIRVKRDNEYIWIKLVFVLIPDHKTKYIERIFILIQDYSQVMAERMTNLMYSRIDSLTQTWNKRYSEELISSKIRANENGLFAVFDIDDFKNVNDSFGHLTGDQLLKKISSIVCESITDSDVFGRLKGDEFALYLKGDFNECLIHFMSIMEKMKFNYYENDKKIEITCSAGVARIKGRRTNFNELYESADAALHDAKRSGKGIYKISIASLIEDDDE